MRRLALVLLGVAGTSLLVPPALGAAVLPDDVAAVSVNPIANFPAGTFFTVDQANSLERFNVAAPGVRLGSVAISGLGVGESILGIDFRPATGQLYGLGSTSRLYIINVVTGAASPIGASFSPALAGTNFGFDFNPTIDRIRVVSDAEQNLRLNPDTGQVAVVDVNINPAGNLVGSAYTNNSAAATSTVLYAIDSVSDQLVIQNPPNDGTVTPVGPLGVDCTGAAGFDIAAGSNVAYAALTPNASLVSSLYTINLSTGTATIVGAIALSTAVRGLALVTGPETVFGVTTGNKLVSFRSNTPGTLLARAPITGLQAGEDILGIDFRPATGELFGLGSTSRLYRIDTWTGAATQVGSGQFVTLLSGTDFGFDFNPTVDRIRVVSDAEQNLRLNPNTGGITSVDIALKPAGNVVAAAYTNNFAGAVSTTLYDIDSVSDLLLIQSPPNNGTVSAVGPLTVNASGLTGFDIAPSGMAYASITLAGATTTNFYTVNLVAGAASLVGTIAGGEAVRDTAIQIATEAVYAVTQQAGPSHQLIRFNPATPGVNLSSVAITGLQAGENILAIDFRPATGELFALGSTSRVYTVDVITGAATQVGSGTFATPLNGTSFGFDFNPTVDRIRVVSNAEQNLRLSPSTGQIAFVDTNLTPAGNVVASAYANSFAGATVTTLYDIDWLAGNLLTQNPPNNGVLNLVGSLGISITSDIVSFDIGSLSGNAYLSVYTGGANPGFYKVNLATGAAILIGNVNVTDPLVGFSVQIVLDERIFRDGFE